jgi:hypothetical protein
MTKEEKEYIEYIATATLTAIQAVSKGKLYTKVITDDGRTIELRKA